MILAGFWIRAFAHLIDFFTWNLMEYGLEMVITRGFGLDATGEQVVGVVLSLAMAYLYYVEVPLRVGTTPGKLLFRIRVISAERGGQPTRKEMTLRLFGYAFSYLVLGCGFLMVMFHPQKLGLHDLIAGTMSVRVKKKESAQL